MEIFIKDFGKELAMKKLLITRRMFAILFCFLWLTKASPLLAQTDIPPGNVSGTWKKANSPYQINGEITIPNGQTLVIEPGVEVVFTGHYKFNVQGRLLAIGTRQDTIIFTAQDPETGWHGIRFVNTPSTNDSSKIVYCSLKYGKANEGDIFDECGGAICVKSFSKVLISNSLIAFNMNSGNPATAAGGGIALWIASPIIKNCEFKENTSVYGAAIAVYYSSNALICNNHIHDNTGHGTINIGGDSAPILINNLIENNHTTTHGILHFEGNSGRSVAMINNTIVNNHGGSGAVWESDGSPLLIINTILYGNEPVQVALEARSELQFHHCLIEGGLDGFKGRGNFKGVYQNCVDSDPLFVGSNDFHLQDASPCISAGCDSNLIGKKMYYAPASDLEGNPRQNPPGSSPDLGAFENESGGPYIRYFSHTLDDSEGNGNGRADAGETVELVLTLKNTSSDAAGISAVLTSDDPDVQVTQAAAGFGDLAKGQGGSNQSAPFAFIVNPSSITHLSDFNLNITSEGGTVHNETFKILIGTPAILLVDDDRGEQYEKYFTSALEMKQKYAETWDVSIEGPPAADVLQHYRSVIWFTGDDRDSTLTAPEQAVIAAFLDGGGKLLITGQDIGYDLAEEGSAGDSAFYAEYLHARYISDDSDEQSVKGINGDPVTGIPSRVSVIFNGTFDGADNQTAPDVLSPVSPAETILQYGSKNIGAALRYEDPSTGSRLIYLAFGFEGISGPVYESSSELIGNIFSWLEGQTPVEEQVVEPVSPKSCVLYQNYPNPFNPVTTICFYLPVRTNVKFQIYDSLGRAVQTPIDAELPAGEHRVLFDARGLASGIYFYLLNTEDGIQYRKALFIK